jgi:glycerophosphoryl diester phosphodiesterase
MATALPKLFAHRGLGDPFTAELGVPENSAESITWAANHGADAVEGDVQVSGKSSSGSRTMYIMHDDLLDRTTNGSGDTNTRPWSYIDGLWLELPRDLDGNGNYDNTTVRVPTFNTWLKAAKATGKTTFSELKGDLWTESQVKKYAAAVNAQGMASKLIVAGGATKLGYVKKHLPEAKRSYSVNSFPSISTVKNIVGSSGYATISMTYAAKSPTYVKNLQAAGIKGLVYTLDKTSHYEAVLPLGFYGWFCDNIEHANNWLTANTI